MKARRWKVMRDSAGNPLMTDGRGLLYVCMPTRLGWKCGRCLHGNVGIADLFLRKCRVCGIKVARVLVTELKPKRRRK